MRDLTKWEIVHVGALTPSGEEEIHARTIRKRDCEILLEGEYITVGRAAKNDLVIRRIERADPFVVEDELSSKITRAIADCPAAYKKFTPSEFREVVDAIVERLK